MRVHWANRLEEPCLSAGRDGNGFAEKLVRPVHMRVHWANRLEEPCLSAGRDGNGFAAAQNLNVADRVVELLVSGSVTGQAFTQNRWDLLAPKRHMDSTRMHHLMQLLPFLR